MRFFYSKQSDSSFNCSDTSKKTWFHPQRSLSLSHNHPHDFQIVRFLAPFQFVGFAYDLLVSWKCVWRSQGIHECRADDFQCVRNMPLRSHARPYNDFKDVVRDHANTVQCSCQFDWRAENAYNVGSYGLCHTKYCTCASNVLANWCQP